MRDELTEIVCIVDQSGSMYRVKEDAVGGFNQFLDEQASIPGEATVTLTLFNHEIEVVCESVPIEQAGPLDMETYRPGGMTALMDAVGTTLERLSEKFDQRDQAPGQVIVLILTDGRENASSRFRQAEVAEMIDRREEERDWEFVFWGADIDADEVAGSLHIDSDRVSRVEASSDGLGEAFGEMSRLTRDFRESGVLDKLEDPPDGDLHESSDPLD